MIEEIIDDIILFILALAVIYPFILIMVIIENKKGKEEEVLSKDYYLLLDKDGREYLQSCNNGYNDIKSPEETLKILNSENCNIFNYGRIPKVSIYYTKQRERHNIKAIFIFTIVLCVLAIAIIYFILPQK